MDYDRRTAKIARYYERTKGGTLGQPVSLQVALTDSCFNRCIGCGHPQRVQRKMDRLAWTTFLCKRLLVESVCYSGGDPMAYPEFNDVMHYHLDIGVPYGMTITGYVPPTINMELMRQAAWIRVSLDAVDEAIYAKVRGHTPLRKVLRGIEDMLAAGCNVSLGVTLHPDNESHFPSVLDWAQSRGITDVEARYAYPNSNPKWPDFTLSDRHIQKFNRCHAALYQLYIDSDGSVFPCCVTAGDTRSAPTATNLGNIFTEQWEAIWERVVKYSEIPIAHLPEVCRTCCVQRLSEINYVCDQIPTGKSFF